MVKKVKKKPVVLVVEDESGINEVYQIVLQKAGYNVLAAFNGEEALKLVQAKDPDIILLDLRMPKMDGIEFLKAYSLEEHPKVKVVVLSNYDMQKEIDAAHELGATRYVLKAWTSPKELQLLVDKTLEE